MTYRVRGAHPCFDVPNCAFASLLSHTNYSSSAASQVSRGVDPYEPHRGGYVEVREQSTDGHSLTTASSTVIVKLADTAGVADVGWRGFRYAVDSVAYVHPLLDGALTPQEGFDALAARWAAAPRAVKELFDCVVTSTSAYLGDPSTPPDLSGFARRDNTDVGVVELGSAGADALIARADTVELAGVAVANVGAPTVSIDGDDVTVRVGGSAILSGSSAVTRLANATAPVVAIESDGIDVLRSEAGVTELKTDLGAVVRVEAADVDVEIAGGALAVTSAFGTVLSASGTTGALSLSAYDGESAYLSAPGGDVVTAGATVQFKDSSSTTTALTLTTATVAANVDIQAHASYTAPTATSLVTRAIAEGLVAGQASPQIVWQPSGVSSPYVYTGDAAGLSALIASSPQLVQLVLVEPVTIDAPIDLKKRTSVVCQGSFPVLTFSGTGRWVDPPSVGFRGPCIYSLVGSETHAIVEFSAPAAAYITILIDGITCTDVSGRVAFIQALSPSQLMATWSNCNLVFGSGCTVLDTVGGNNASVIDIRSSLEFNVLDPAAVVSGGSSGILYWRPETKVNFVPTNPQTNGAPVTDLTQTRVDTLGDTVVAVPASRVHNSVVAWDSDTQRYVDDQEGWHDLLGTFDQRVGGGGANPFTLTQYDVAGRVFEYATTNGAAQQSQAYLSFHWPHDWSPGSDTFIHLHLSVNQSVTTTGSFQVWAGFAKSGEVFPALTQLVNITKTFAGASDVRKHHVVEIPLSTAGGSATTLDSSLYETDGFLQVYVNYLRGTAPDTMGNNVPIFVHGCDVHYLSTGRPTKNRVSPFNS